MQFIPHDYQKYTIDYMVSHPITAAILDMGLGKTLQIITFLLARKGQKSLVITPTALLYNWKKEIEKLSVTNKYIRRIVLRNSIRLMHIIV